MWFGNKVKGFTLLEALVSLLVISGGLLLFQGMTQLLSSEIHYHTSNRQADWLLFADQLETELARSKFEKVENHKLYILQDGKHLALGKSKKDDFRKTDDKGRGYQPMILGVKKTSIVEEGAIIKLHFVFEEGLEREFIYRVEKES